MCPDELLKQAEEVEFFDSHTDFDGISYPFIIRYTIKDENGRTLNSHAGEVAEELTESDLLDFKEDGIHTTVTRDWIYARPNREDELAEWADKNAGGYYA